MEIRQIKELMASMGRTGIKHLSMKKDGFELVIERSEGVGYRPDSLLENENGMRTEAAFHHIPAPLPKGKEVSVRSESKNIQEETAGVFVTSPMVGTFYSAPSPEDPSFVKVGDKIDKSQVVCIIEAMKVMNEIKAGVSGTVLEILVENGQPVEFGTKIYKIG